VAEGCRRAGCALVGGEISEMPAIYAGNEYDLVGFAVGVVEATRIVDGRAVRPGDVVLGLASSGMHSNGCTLALHLVFDRLRPAPRARGRASRHRPDRRGGVTGTDTDLRAVGAAAARGDRGPCDGSRHGRGTSRKPSTCPTRGLPRGATPELLAGTTGVRCVA